MTTPWVGNGWGLFAPPSPGDVVDVHFQEGGREAAFIALRFYSLATVPLEVPSGEFWLVHKSGSLLKLTNDGKALVNGQVELDLNGPVVNITATTSVNITAPAVNVGGLGQTLRRLVTDAMVTLFNNHTHVGVQPGGGVSGVPQVAMDSSELTSTILAG